MKFNLIIDPTKEEELTVVVHSRTVLIDRLEELLREEDRCTALPAYTEDELRMLPVDEIECITVMEGKTWAIATDNTRYRLKQRLYELEEQLPPHFFRINKSALANQRRLVKFIASYRGGVDAVFRCGYREYVSRRCFSQIKRRFDL